ncbi:MAG: dUTP diphosphatase [Clostridiales bacterium]|nr:dUTP diphosphatase [Clostridiales bacterium]
MQLPYVLTSPHARPPERATEGAAGLDLCAALAAPLRLPAGGRAIVPTGLCLAIPQGCVGLLFARSGLAARQGVTLANGVGVIDSDYRGEVGVALVNLGAQDYDIAPGDRIAQLVLMACAPAEPVRVGALGDTVRGCGGFGSTGKGGQEGGD